MKQLLLFLLADITDKVLFVAVDKCESNIDLAYGFDVFGTAGVVLSLAELPSKPHYREALQGFIKSVLKRRLITCLRSVAILQHLW